MIHCAAIFTDHMLLQRGKPIAVFGTGTAGEPVTVSVPQRHCTVSSAVRQDGTWRVTLPPMPAGTGCTLTVNEQEFSDVAFGEVWLAGGQSNMEFMLKDARNGTAELEQCRNSNVRYFQVPRNTFADDAYTAAWNAARWELPDPETSGTWSAAAYLAAKELAQTQGVPVGIIGCNYGGSSVSCWLPESDLQAHAAGHPYLQDYADAAAGKTDAEMIAEYDEYVAYHTAWESRMQKCYQEDSNMPWDEIIRRCGENRYPGPLGIKSPYRPAGMYHTMLQRVVPYTIRGFFYYQGENDEIRPDTYGTLLTMLIARWRQDFEDVQLPFILVQLPMHTYGGHAGKRGVEPAAGGTDAGIPDGKAYRHCRDSGLRRILQHSPCRQAPCGTPAGVAGSAAGLRGTGTGGVRTDLPQLRCGGQYADGVLFPCGTGHGVARGTLRFPDRRCRRGVSRCQSSAGRRHGAADGGRSAGSCCGTVQLGELRCSYAVREKRDSGGTVPDGSFSAAADGSL